MSPYQQLKKLQITKKLKIQLDIGHSFFRYSFEVEISQIVFFTSLKNSTSQTHLLSSIKPSRLPSLSQRPDRVLHFLTEITVTLTVTLVSLTRHSTNLVHDSDMV